MKHRKVIIAVLSCLMAAPLFADRFNINQNLSSSVKDAVMDSAFRGDDEKTKHNFSVYAHYKAMEKSIKENKMSDLRKLLKEKPLTDLIKWHDKNGQEKVGNYNTDIRTEAGKWRALKPYETLFITATLERNEKALKILLKSIINQSVVQNQVYTTMDNLIKFHTLEDFDFFHKFVVKNNLLYKQDNKGESGILSKDLILLITTASSDNFFNGQILDTLIADYLSLGTPSELGKNLMVRVNNLPRKIYDVQDKEEEYFFNFEQFYNHLDKNQVAEITLDDKCNFITDVVSIWRSTSQVLGDVYVDDVFIDTFNYLLDSLNLETPKDAKNKYIHGASFDWEKADFEGVIHDKVTQQPCTKFYYNLRESEKEPWAKKFEAKYGFAKTAIFVPLRKEN